MKSEWASNPVNSKFQEYSYFQARHQNVKFMKIEKPEKNRPTKMYLNYPNSSLNVLNLYQISVNLA